MGGGEPFLIIDDRALPKKGKPSVSVAPQYTTSLGKNANCQTPVSSTLARFGPMFAAEIRRRRVDRLRQHTHWRRRLDGLRTATSRSDDGSGPCSGSGG